MPNIVEFQPTQASSAAAAEPAEPAADFGGFEPFIDEQVVGAFLGLPPRRVLELARKGKIPAHPIGRIRKTWRFRISEVSARFGSPVPQTRARISPGSSRTQ